MKKIVLNIIGIIFCISSFSQEMNNCGKISELEEFSKLDISQSNYIESYLNSIETNHRNRKTLFHPNNTLNFEENCSFPINYKNIRLCYEILKRRQTTKLIIEVNCDGIEQKENPEINTHRGEMVRRIFNYYGIPNDRINIIYNNDNYPIDTNKTEKGRRNNRNIKLKIPYYL